MSAPQRGDPARPPSPIPPEVVCLADYERLALARMDASAQAYFNGGAADEITLRDNEQAWSKLRLQSRVLRSLAGGDTSLELFGRRLAHPILLAPVALQRWLHPDGEAATVQAAAALEAGMVLSTQSSVPMETVMRLAGPAAERGPMWFQLYWQGSREDTLALLRRAEAAGFEALVLTVDAPVQGPRDRERRVGFHPPEGVCAVHLQGLRSRSVVPPSSRRSALFDGLLQEAPNWDEVAWLITQTHLPVLLKGITHPDDALLAEAAGAAGVIVSNHGGRSLDTLPATAALLPAVVRALGGRMPVLVDGGVRRGTDVLKALALGARAVLVGRPQVHALAVAGAHGVAHVLRLLRDELEITMALSGCRHVSEVSADALWRPQGPYIQNL